MPQGNSSAPFAIEVLPNPESVGRRAAEVVAAAVDADPDLVLAVPTGSTPLPMFNDLIGRVDRGVLDLSRVRLFGLDEYVGATPDDPNSLTGWLHRVFLDAAGVLWANVHHVDASTSDPDSACARYETELAAAGGLDLAILGLGPNGHIAYNEPGSAADSRTRVLDLTPESVAQAEAGWAPGSPSPRRAMTIGIATLLEAKRIVLVVTGANKADILRRSLEDRMSAATPASWLRLAPGKLLVVADEAAATALAGRDRQDWESAARPRP